MKYEHCYEATLVVLCPVPSDSPSRKKITREQILKRLTEIVTEWSDEHDVESHVEGSFDYLESNVKEVDEQTAKARAGLIPESDHHFIADEEV